jgi:hypothetical protein
MIPHRGAFQKRRIRIDRHVLELTFKGLVLSIAIRPQALGALFCVFLLDGFLIEKCGCHARFSPLFRTAGLAITVLRREYARHEGITHKINVRH